MFVEGWHACADSGGTLLISAGHLYITTEVFCERLLVLHISIRKRASAAVVFEPRETPWYTYLLKCFIIR